ncbi:hypothetical protein ABH926_000042 [Catenulispora sp. GP43]
MVGQIAAKGVPAPIQVGCRRLVERSQGWMNGYGKIRRCFAGTIDSQSVRGAETL